MEKKQTEVDTKKDVTEKEATKLEKLTASLEESLNTISESIEEKDLGGPLTSLADITLLDDPTLTDQHGKPYSTELLENIQKLDPSLTMDQIKELIEYLKGSSRPGFMDTMLTQTNEKLTESLKLMTILELMRLPALLDYLNALQKNILNPESIASMSYEDISKVSVNVQKEISDILQLGLKVTTQLSSTNTVPTKVEKLANALLGVSESTRQRIEEIIAMEQ